MEEQREEELDLALESLWVEVRRVGKEKGIFSFCCSFWLGAFMVVVRGGSGAT